MSENIQFAAAVAEIGMLLNDSKFKGTSTFESAIQRLPPSIASKSIPIEQIESVVADSASQATMRFLSTFEDLAHWIFKHFYLHYRSGPLRRYLLCGDIS